MLKDDIFMLYAMECEGELPTRMGQLNSVVKMMRKVADPNDFATQCAVYDAVGLDSDTLTEDEVKYIVDKVVEARYR
jgi:hypothetical protein